MEQLDSALDALELELSDKELLRLDEIWPGHEPAPEDYTW